MFLSSVKYISFTWSNVHQSKLHIFDFDTKLCNKMEKTFPKHRSCTKISSEKKFVLICQQTWPLNHCFALSTLWTMLTPYYPQRGMEGN